MPLDPGEVRDELRRAAAFVYVDEPAAPALSSADAHHLQHVLRLRVGEAVAVGDGRGQVVLCRVISVAPGASEPARDAGGRRRSSAERRAFGLEPLAAPVQLAAPSPELCVAFALAKGERAEWTVQKLTEIGVDRLVPLITERSVVRVTGEDAKRRSERLRRVAREAGAQSRRPLLPEVSEPMTLAEFVASAGEPASLALAEPGSPYPNAGLHTIVIGPEGGWSERELATVRGRVGLGEGVLRTETAALVAGALLTHNRAIAGR